MQCAREVIVTIFGCSGGGGEHFPPLRVDAMVVSMGGSQCAGGVRCPQFLAVPASTLVYSLPRLFTPTLGSAAPNSSHPHPDSPPQLQTLWRRKAWLCLAM